jgi:cytochrome P450
VAYEESRQLLPYFGACIRESLRLDPPATNLFARVTPAASSASSSGGGGGGSAEKEIDGVLVPPGTEVTSNAFVVQRDPVLYAPDPEAYRPGRWLEGGAARAAEMDAGQFVFGVGSRVCLGKDIATMELWKLLPEVRVNFFFFLLFLFSTWQNERIPADPFFLDCSSL